ncbi:beta-1,3-galactosyl-O-glycosyl-glycoprotein beta-1,6-N-acetylglucosaminyltransferase-like [Physella acuta]|uniref:beta-1,3-galactosyl-O-glycosyl-glycoprotein beta-1,6-N-acetylglucosaminyltransferase-like n=1 Tax=Physella acuta TaxID=109671 RepID=UPI0027DBD4DA|nr:beta-1,3-galactosyl-O-glycosyl-glycoprotein beta-1,6-N-acetylglucosaminyltransferase-like [Physella acuta]
MKVVRLNLSSLNRTLTFVLLLMTLTTTVYVLRLGITFQPLCRDDYQNVAGSAPNGTDPAHSEKYSHPKYDVIREYHSRGLGLRHKFNCRKLFEDDEHEHEKASMYKTAHEKTFTTFPDNKAPSLLKDCEAFKHIRGYRNETGSEEEQRFPLAYVVLVHRDFEHLERLLRSLYMPQHSFCIHVDAKSPESLKTAAHALAECFPNVALVSEPQTIIYAHMTRLMADIVCMRDLLELDQKWKYLINYAATEFPLRSNLETVQILKSLKGRNDIHESYKARIPERYKWEYAVVNGRMKATTVTLAPPPHNITITKGQAYNTFSREFVEWALTDPKPRDLLKWSEKTYSPDEHYWGTLNNLYHNPFLHTPGGFKGEPDKKGYITKFISWQYSNPKFKCQGQVIHSICVFSARDLPTMLFQNHIGANKFDLTFDPVAYACMEEYLENKTASTLPFNLAFYKRLYFVHMNSSHSGLTSS